MPTRNTQIHRCCNLSTRYTGLIILRFYFMHYILVVASLRFRVSSPRDSCGYYLIRLEHGTMLRDFINFFVIYCIKNIWHESNTVKRGFEPVLDNLLVSRMFLEYELSLAAAHTLRYLLG